MGRDILNYPILVHNFVWPTVTKTYYYYVWTTHSVYTIIIFQLLYYSRLAGTAYFLMRCILLPVKVVSTSNLHFWQNLFSYSRGGGVAAETESNVIEWINCRVLLIAKDLCKLHGYANLTLDWTSHWATSPVIFQPLDHRPRVRTRMWRKQSFPDASLGVVPL